MYVPADPLLYLVSHECSYSILFGTWLRVLGSVKDNLLLI